MAEFGTAVFTAVLNNSQLIAGAAQSRAALGGIGSGLNRVGSALTQGVTLPLLGVAALGVSTATKIDTAWNDVRKTYNALPGVIEKQIRPTGLLGKKVTELTTKYGYARDQVIGVLGQISAMGFTGKTATKLLQRGIEYATAAGIDLNDGLVVAVSLMNTFQLKGKRLDKTMYGLNRTENETAATGFDLSVGLARAGGAAQSLVGPSFKATDAVAAIASGMAVLKARGQETYRSADALRAIFQRLYVPSDKVKGLFDKMGVSLSDAQGNIVPFPKLLHNIAGNFDKLSQQEQLAFGKQSIGVEFGPLFLQMIKDVQRGQKKGSKSISQFDKTFKEFGQSAKGQQQFQRELNIQQDSFAAALGRVQAAWGLLIDTIKPIIGSVLKPVANFIASLITGLAKLSTNQQKTILIVGAFVAVLGPVILLLGLFITAISVIAGAVAAVASPLLILVGLIIAIGVALAANKKGRTEFFDHLRDIWNSLVSVGKTVVDIFQRLFKALNDAGVFTAIQDGMNSLLGALNSLMPILKLAAIILGVALYVALVIISRGFQLFGHVVEVAAAIIGPVIKAIVAIFQWLFDKLVGHSIIPDLINGIMGWFSKLIGFFGPIVGAIKKVLVGGFRLMKALVVGIFQGLVLAVLGIFSAVVNTVYVIMGLIIVAIDVGTRVIKKIWHAAWGTLKKVVSVVWHAIVGVVRAYVNLVKTAISGGLAIIKKVWSTAWNGIKTVAKTIWGWISGFFGREIRGWQHVIGGGLRAIKTVWRTVWGSFKDVVKTIFGAIKRIVDGFISKITGAFDKVKSGFDKVKGLAEKVGGGLGFLAHPHFSRGGLVPGRGNKDTVDARLTPGEFVVTRAAVKRVGLAQLNALNASNRPFAMDPTAMFADLTVNAQVAAPRVTGIARGGDTTAQPRTALSYRPHENEAASYGSRPSS